MKPITEETVAGLLDRCDIKQRAEEPTVSLGARILPFRRHSRSPMVAGAREAASTSLSGDRKRGQRTSKGFFFYSTQG